LLLDGDGEGVDAAEAIPTPAPIRPAATATTTAARPRFPLNLFAIIFLPPSVTGGTAIVRAGVKPGMAEAYVYALKSRSSFGGGSGDAAQITSWVSSHFTGETINGATIYNLAGRTVPS
jgi:hypothetical protein